MSDEGVARAFGDQLQADLARSRQASQRARHLVTAMEHRWPERLAPVGVASDGSCVVYLHALFEVTLAPEGGHVSARLRGWDRDLTDCIPGDPSAPADGVPALVDRVARAVDDLRPAADGIAARAASAHVAPSHLDTAAALAARAARERGDDPEPPLIGHDRLGELIRERWPATEVCEHRRGGELAEYFLRPYGSSRIVVTAEPRAGLGAGACLGTVVAPVVEPALLARRDEPHTRDLTRALDGWLKATMPPAWVLARPLLADP